MHFKHKLIIPVEVSGGIPSRKIDVGSLYRAGGVASDGQ